MITPPSKIDLDPALSSICNPWFTQNLENLEKSWKKITLENSWKYHGKMTSLWKNEILSPELPKLVNFSKKSPAAGN